MRYLDTVHHFFVWINLFYFIRYTSFPPDSPNRKSNCNFWELILRFRYGYRFPLIWRDNNLFRFNIPDRDSFFSPSQRIRIIWECLSRIQFAGSNSSGVGIQKLLADDTYLAGFPLHDGPWEAPKGQKKLTNLRAALYDQWGQFSRFYKFQPVEQIKNYFGEVRM